MKRCFEPTKAINAKFEAKYCEARFSPNLGQKRQQVVISRVSFSYSFSKLHNWY